MSRRSRYVLFFTSILLVLCILWPRIGRMPSNGRSAHGREVDASTNSGAVQLATGGPPAVSIAAAPVGAGNGRETITASNTTPAQSDGGQISASALREMRAMQEEKASFTPAQRKLDSQLVFALKRSRDEPIAKGQVPQLRIGAQADARGMVEVDIKANLTMDLLQQIKNLGGAISDNYPLASPVHAFVPLSQVEKIAALPAVKFIRQSIPAQVNNSDPEGVFAHRDDVARSTFEVDASGVKIGVLSDSVDHLSQSQAAGALGQVTVLPGQSGMPGSGEGTAMLEIVHAMAPGADLFFATSRPTDKQFATNILNLRFLFGCDVIVDDINTPGDSPFQDGIIAQAVNAVTASGALYFSSAANSGNLDSGTSGTWEGDFRNGGTVLFPTNGLIHNFSATGSPTNFNSITKTNEPYYTILYWSDPLDASTNDYDLFALDSTGTHVVSSSVDWQYGPAEPIEYVPSPGQGQRVVVVLASGAPRFLHIDTARAQLSSGTQGSIRGHNGATNAFTVAAVDANLAYPFGPFTGGPGNPVEDFSSDGPRRMFYFADGTPMTPGNFSSTGGIVFQKPDIAAADGVTTTLPPGGLNPFHGTSAAAPHAAAIAALLKSYNTNLTVAQIRSLLTTTALDIMAAGVDRDSGVGIVMPYAALQAAPAPPPVISVVTPDSGAPGKPIFIYGYSFRTTTNVQIGGASAPFVILSNSLVVAAVPAAATNGGLRVTTPFGIATAPFVVLPVPVPADDNFTNSTTLAGSAFMISGTTAGASKQPGEPNHAGNSGGKSIWYRWTAPSSGAFTLDTIGSDFNTLLAVYTGTTVSNLTLIAGDNDSGSNLTSLVTFNAAAGTTYQIAVDGVGGASGNVVLRIEPATTTIYSTAFERSEGFLSGFALAGQNGWTNTGNGGNGVVSNVFIGQGQQGYIGLSAPVPATNTALFRPLNYVIDTNTRPLVQFSVSMVIHDSNTGFQDKFWWITRNTSAHGLFGLVFDPVNGISYVLDNGTSQFETGFLTDQLSTLVIAMDFGRNVWNAIYNGLPVVPSFPSAPPITATGAALTLGDIDAFWNFGFSSAPGNGYMLFDNMQITAGPSVVPRILAAPQSQTVIAGSDIFLSAAAAGSPPLSYQWYYNNSAIAHATNASLTLFNVRATQTGSYVLLVANANGSATNGAVITITNPPPRAVFAMPTFSGSNTLRMDVNVAIGNTYRLQASTRLTNWATLATFYANGTNTTCFDPSPAAFPSRFYRLVSP